MRPATGGEEPVLLRAYVYVLIGASIVWAGVVAWLVSRCLLRAAHRWYSRAGAR